MSRRKQKHFIWPSESRCIYNRTAMHFMDDHFMNLGEEVIIDSGVSYLNRDLCANTYELHHCLSRDSVSLSGLN